MRSEQRDRKNSPVQSLWDFIIRKSSSVTELRELVERKASLMREYDSVKAEISELEKMQKRIESLEQSQAHKSRTGDNLT